MEITPEPSDITFHLIILLLLLIQIHRAIMQCLSDFNDTYNEVDEEHKDLKTKHNELMTIIRKLPDGLMLVKLKNKWTQPGCSVLIDSSSVNNSVSLS